jgi:hypothetical protein
LRATEILYEPLPIGRIGVRIADQEVVIAQDYSCFASLLEEYIAHGAISIALPKSSPEAKSIENMPLLLRRRIRVIDDELEDESLARLFYGVHRELGLTFDENTRQLVFPNGIPPEVEKAVSKMHSVTKRLMLAYNKQIQAEVNLEKARNVYQHARKLIKDSNSKLILAQLEGLLNHYESASFDSCSPKGETRIEVINAFDQLVNDADYVNYSTLISDLSTPQNRETTLFKLRTLSRSISAKKIAGVSWDYLSKFVNLSTGVPIPESKDLAIFSQSKPLPTLIDMQPARQRAIKNWMATANTEQPFNRAGELLASTEIRWMAPLPSTQVYGVDEGICSLGTAGELAAALIKLQAIIDQGNGAAL